MFVPAVYPDSDEPLFSFGVIADVQYADSDSNLEMDRHFRRSIAKLGEAITEFNRHPLEFIVHLGDLIDHDLENAPPVLDLLQRIRAPVRQVLGNHDFTAEQIPGGYSDVDDVLSALGLTKPYYSFDSPGWRMVVLDTNEVGIIEHPADTAAGRSGAELLDQIQAEGRINAKPWNGTIGPEQREWLAQTVRSASSEGLRSAVLAHHPVFPAHLDNLLDDRELADWLAGLDGLRLWLNGHQHAGGYGRHRGLQYLTFQGMVQAQTNAYAVVTVYPDRMQVIGYGREPSRLLPLSD